ncbi:MAG TPA: hypothetical protein VI935_01000 [Thermodesulfobacteriota bacterium]|nr:hypothetical protein [Thermodesulfobacteriota bacterium]
MNGTKGFYVGHDRAIYTRGIKQIRAQSPNLWTWIAKGGRMGQVRDRLNQIVLHICDGLIIFSIDIQS